MFKKKEKKKKNRKEREQIKIAGEIDRERGAIHIYISKHIDEREVISLKERETVVTFEHMTA